ncbi:MAG: hypothetical protein N3B18_10910 [Desulfobacterota bacterium]|nr:hypothetical protein [Thermodesulfobacteriota bacterium]
MDKAFVEQMKKRVAAELCSKEIEVVDFWKAELEKILHKKTDSLSSLQIALQEFVGRMENRIKTLKRQRDV